MNDTNSNVCCYCAHPFGDGPSGQPTRVYVGTNAEGRQQWRCWVCTQTNRPETALLAPIIDTWLEDGKEARGSEKVLISEIARVGSVNVYKSARPDLDNGVMIPFFEICLRGDTHPIQCGRVQKGTLKSAKDWCGYDRSPTEYPSHVETELFRQQLIANWLRVLSK